MQIEGLIKIQLTSYQKNLWIDCQRNTDHIRFNSPFLFKIRGSLEAHLLEAAWAETVRKHDNLRTHFIYDSYEPKQCITDACGSAVHFEDVSTFGNSRERADLRVQEIINSPIDIGLLPLHKVIVIKEAEHAFQLLIVFHHLIVDGYSIKMILNDLSQFYNNKNLSAAFPKRKSLGYTMTDFIVHENTYLDESYQASAQAFWEEYLDKGQLNIHLPKKTKDKSTTAAKRYFKSVNDKTFSLFRKFKYSNAVSSFEFLAAVLAVLLHRHTRQTDIIIGYPINKRTLKFRNLGGFFVNNLPLRFTFEKPASFLDLCRTVNAHMRDASRYDHYAAHKILNIIRKGSTPESDHSYFNVILSEANFSSIDIKFNSLDIESTPVNPSDTLSKFTLMYDEHASDLRFAIEYDASLYEESFIVRFLDDFESLIEAFLTDPDQNIHENFLPLRPVLTPLRYEKNAYEAHGPFTIVYAFRQQAQKYPDVPAVVMENDFLTYSQLDRRSNQLARKLRDLGLGQDRNTSSDPLAPSSSCFVAICLERSIDMMIAILAALKADVAYVPLDPSYPDDRLSFICNDTGVMHIITDNRLAGLFNNFSGKKILMDSPVWQNESEAAPDVAIRPDDLAYIIYTSGSTGLPKGVMIEHKSLFNIAHSLAKAFHIDHGTHVLQFASFAFDASVAEWSATLCCGATLFVLAGRAEQPVSERLARSMRLYVIHVVTLPPSLVASLPEEVLAPLKTLIVAGEACPAAVVNKWHERLLLINGYGPTEVAIGASVFNCDARYPASTIGTAFPNVDIHIMDEQFRQTAIGETGEIYIGGWGLARGYMNRPELTAQRFIPHPFKAGERLYRTGDLARYLHDGNIEYIGRNDQQIKLRGYRIELPEIETVLMSHQDVMQAVILPEEEASGRQQLVAYLLPQKESTCREAELIKSVEDFAGKTLPGYMVPSLFIVLSALPLTPNGKIDKTALRSMRQQWIFNKSIDAPRAGAESQLAQIWCKILSVGEVGRHQSFFELGGDSILCIQMVAQANAEGLAIDIKQVFETPTVAQLASIDAHDRQAKGNGPITHGKHIEQEKKTPLSPIQHWFFEQNLAEPNHYNQSVCLLCHRKLNTDILNTSFGHLTKIHGVLRMRFYADNDNGYRTPYDDLIAENICSHVPLYSSDDTDRYKEMHRAVLKAQSGLDIHNGTVIKAVLFSFGDDRQQELVIVAHHLVIDTVSWRTLLKDLDLIYQSIADNTPLPEQKESHIYLQWANHLVPYAQDERMKAECDYWTQNIPQGRMAFSSDLDHDYNPVADVSKKIISLSKEDTRLLLKVVPGAYNTQINDVLLAALSIAVKERTATSELWLDMEGHGREKLFDDIDISETVGWFTAAFPFYHDAEHCNDIPSILKSIKERLRQIPDKGVNFGVIKYLCKLDGLADRLKQLPARNCVLNYLGQLHDIPVADGIFSIIKDNYNLNISGFNQRSHKLELTAYVAQETFTLCWQYSKKHYHDATVDGLAEAFMTALKAIIAHCCSSSNFGYTPSDFPLAAMKQAELDIAFARQPDIEDVYPLSPLQAGLLFHSLYQEGSEAYRIQSLIKMTGDVDEHIAELAWNTLINHNEVFRSGILWRGLSQPHQFVRSRIRPVWTTYHWKDDDLGTKQEKLRELKDADRRTAFDLSVPPLSRFHFIHWSGDTCYLLWTHHHIILDGWCRPIILRDFLTAYKQIADGASPELPDRPPYRHYIRWLREQDNHSSEMFWRKYLKGLEAPLLLSRLAVKSLPVPRDTRHAQISVRFTEAETGRLRNFARDHGITANTLIQAAWSILLGRYTGRDDIVFGATFSGRSIGLPGIEDMVGLFINTLPLRMNVSGEKKAIQFLREIQEQTPLLIAHCHLALSKIKSLQDTGEPADTLFDTVVIFENYPNEIMPPVRPGNIDIENIAEMETTEYPLVLMVIPRNTSLELLFNFSPASFTDRVINQMTVHFRQTLFTLINKPDDPINALSIFPEEEYRKIVIDWNGTEKIFPAAWSLHQMFEYQARTRPHRIALSCNGSSLTYEALNDRSNKLALQLIAMGVTHDTVVGVSMERSPELVLSLLGILKAGGAYLPLDSAQPAQRLAYMLADSNCSVLLTTHALADKFSGYKGKVLFTGNDASNLPAEANHDNPGIIQSSDALAYVIYTSGSTGKPKGVRVMHRNLTNVLCHMRDELGVTEQDRLLAVTSIGFDISALEIFMPLISGARLVIAGDQLLWETSRLINSIAAHSINMMQATPVSWKLLTDSGWNPPDGFKVLCGGEEMTIELARALNRNNARVWNLYGPTETTVWSTMAFIDKLTEPVTIGKPISNTRTYILDGRLRPVPIGFPGRLFIAGAGVAAGYLNQPSLTSERFIPDPFFPGNIMYDTGDTASYAPCGNIRFLGRSDFQIKLRGHRIELEEIVSVMKQSSAVREALVILRPGSNGEKQLLGYFTTNDMEHAYEIQDEIRENIRRSLPAYMHPAAFVPLERFPVTFSGKVDRAALPMPDMPESTESPSSVPSETETILTGIWRNFLGNDKISIHDNFFEWGGDSISAIKVAAAGYEKGIHFNVKQVFEHPTVHQLAGHLESAAAGKSRLYREPEAGALPLQKGCYPASPLQAGILFHFLGAADKSLYFVQGLYQVTGNLEVNLFRRAWEIVFHRHETLRTGFAWGNNKPPMQYSEPALPLPWHYEYVDDKGTANWVNDLLKEDRNIKFDLAATPLFRLRLIERSDGQYYLLWSYHHIILDGWSRSLILDEVLAVYEQLKNDSDIRLHTGKSSRGYIDWLQWQDTGAAETFWRKYLSGFSQPAYFRPGNEKPDLETASTGNYSWTISRELTDTLLHVARINRCTPSTIIQALWAILLGQYSGREDIVFGITLSGRSIDLPDISQMTGLFINTLPLRLNLSELTDWGMLLKKVTEQNVLLHRYVYTPLNKIRDCSEIAKDRALFDSVVVFENFPKHTNRTEIQLNLVSGFTKAAFAIGLTVIPDNPFAFHLEYQTDYFDEQAIIQLSARLNTVLSILMQELQSIISE